MRYSISFSPVLEAIRSLHNRRLKDGHERTLVAIDGRCGSGKSTLAEYLKENLGCQVVHADDFFPQPYQRTEERLSQPGGNLDRERLLQEVLIPLSEGREGVYRIFDCSIMDFKGVRKLHDCGITVIEGSYSCHPELRNMYHFRIFSDVEKDEQLRRIKARNKDRLPMFIERWIPLEEKYFKEFDIESCCHMTVFPKEEI